jgi:penicillin-binding protein 1A
VKQLPGIAVPPERKQPAVAAARKNQDVQEAPPPRPTLLTKRGADVLVRIEHMLDDANRRLGPVPTSVSTDRKKQRQATIPDYGGALAEALEGKAFGAN